MSDTRAKNIRKTHALAACSLTAALGTALLFSGGLIPVMTYAAPLVVAVLLIPIKREYRAKWAWPVWFATAVLSLLLCPDKEAALFYLFLGYYPILKESFDRVKAKPVRFLVKLLFFVVSIGLMEALIAWLFQMDILIRELEEVGIVAGLLFFALLAAVMMIYDLVLSRIALLYETRLHPKLKHWR